MGTVDTLGFLFPGQGSQYVGMGQALSEYPAGRKTLEEADGVLAMPLSRLIAEGPKEELDQTANTQPALFTISVGWYRVLLDKGFSPRAVAGHSLGEYAAAVAAGALTFADALSVVRLRGELMAAAADGTGMMAAILGLTGAEVVEICEEVGNREAVAANFNAPGQVVVSGLTPAVTRVCEAAKERGARRVVPLAVSGPFHSPFMEPVADRLRQRFATIDVQDPQIPMIANYVGKPVQTAEELVEALVAGVSSRCCGNRRCPICCNRVSRASSK